MHHLFDIQDTLKKMSAPAKTQCNKCKKQESSCYCRTCTFICEKCKGFHSDWPEFSSHEVISLDQLTGDVTNLVPPAKTVLQCSKHQDKQMDLFCDTCQEMICRDCIIRVHRDHQYDLVPQVFPKHKDMLIASLQPVEQQLASVNKGLEGLVTRCGQITTQCQTIETDIKRNIHEIHKALDARQEELITQLHQIAQQKIKSLATQQEHLQLVATQLKSCRDFVQESLRTGSQGEILASMKPVVQQVKEMTANFKPELLVPEQKANMQFTHNQKELTRTCQQFGEVYAPTACPDKCHAEGKGLHIAEVGETATATVHLVDREGSEFTHPVDVTCELVSRHGSSQVGGEVKKVGESKYEISYQPQHSGQHQLHIRVEDVNIARSPFTISAFTTTPTKTIAGLKNPWGVAVNEEGLIITTDLTECSVSIFNVDGEKVKSFGSSGSMAGQMINATGVALTNTGDIMVCDCYNHRIQLFSLEGKTVKCVGSRGSEHLQFSHPLCIAVHPSSNMVYVTEDGNQRVQILNADLTFSSTFGSKGSANGQFECPRGICFDSAGNVYVADIFNHRVQVFTARGEYTRQFGKKGGGEGELNEPVSIAIDSSDIVYVGERNNHRISLFTRNGQFLQSFSSEGEQLSTPTDITTDKDGKIYITDKENSQIQIF